MKAPQPALAPPAMHQARWTQIHEIRAMRHPPRRIMQTPYRAEVFPLTPGSGTFARQERPAPTLDDREDIRHRQRAAGSSVRSMSAPLRNHGIGGPAA